MSLPLSRLHMTFQRTFAAVSMGCLLCLPVVQTGCDSSVDAADEQVRQHMAEGEQKTEAAVSSAPAVPDGYVKAAQVADASPAAKAMALTRLADAERDRAVALLGEADRLESDLLRVVGAINRQSARIQSNNTLVAGLARMEPTKVRQALEQHRTAAQGEQNPVWVEHESGAIQGLKALQEQSAKLQEEIGQLEEQSKGLATQRTKLIADAEQLERKSETAKGQESVELYTQSVDARKQAADLGVQVEALEAKLLPLRQDLVRAQAGQEAVAKTVAAFGKQLEVTQQQWQQVQQQMA